MMALVLTGRRLFVFAIFLSATLLFMVQPLAAKILLPVLGGGPAVWSTCLAAMVLAHERARVLDARRRQRAMVGCHRAVDAAGAFLRYRLAVMFQIALERPGHFRAADGPPPQQAPGDARVRVHSIGVCGTDLHAFAGRQPFFTYPRVLGHELGVEVIDAGSDPHGINAGDRCAVEPYLNCGRCRACLAGRPNCCATLRVLGVHVDGGMRPEIVVPARKLHPSRTLTFEQLALVETLGIGAHAVERAGIAPDDFVLVIGAGPIGLSAIQFVQATGAAFAVMDLRASRLDFCRRHLGVSHTIAAGQDAGEQLRTIGGGELPTVVIDATGSAASMAGTFDLAAQGGRIVFVGLFQGAVSFDDPNFHRRELTLLASRNARPNNFREIIALIEAGRIDTVPWISERFGLAETPQRFPEIAADPDIIKTIIAVDV